MRNCIIKMSDLNLRHGNTSKNQFSRKPVFIGSCLSNQISSKTEFRFWFSMLGYILLLSGWSKNLLSHELQSEDTAHAHERSSERERFLLTLAVSVSDKTAPALLSVSCTALKTLSWGSDSQVEAWRPVFDWKTSFSNCAARFYSNEHRMVSPNPRTAHRRMTIQNDNKEEEEGWHLSEFASWIVVRSTKTRDTPFVRLFVFVEQRFDPLFFLHLRQSCRIAELEELRRIFH